jgi:CHAT domain-containing protein
MFLGNLGHAYQHLGRYQQAIECHQKSLAITQEIGDREGEANSLRGLGNAHYSLILYQRAIEYHQQSLSITREIGDRKGQVNSLIGLGNAHDCLEQYQQAIEFYEQSLAITWEIADREGEAASLGGLGNAYSSLGKYQKAIEYYQHWLVISQEIENYQGKASALLSLGNVFTLIGEDEQAINQYQQSLEVSRKRGDYQTELKSLNGLGNVYFYSYKYNQAIKYYQKSLSIAQKISDPKSEANAQCNIGNVFCKLKQYNNAVEYYHNSLNVAENHGLKKEKTIALNGIGNAYSSLDQKNKAIEYYEQCIEVCQNIENLRVEGEASNNLGYALFKAGRVAEAENKLRASMSLKESLRVGLENKYKISIFEKQRNTYQSLQELLIHENKPNEALEISERGRARAFAELLAHRLSPQLVNDLSITPPTIQEIKQLAKGQNCTLVEYSIIYNESGEEAKFIFIWVIKPTGEITFRPVHLQPLRQEQNTSLSELVNQARESVVDGKKRGDAPRLLQQLHELLIQPITNLLPDNPEEPVIFIPQQSLFLVPFAALLDPETGKFLIEQHIILTAPSIQVLDSTRKWQQHLKDEWASKKDEKNSDFYLVVGNPTMPFIPKIGQPLEQLEQLEGAEEQARTIAKLLNTQPIIRDDATKVNVVQQMLSARLIHLATHGLLDDIRELGVPGAIALAPTEGVDNGFLTAGEILELKLKAELVVLSACLTGLGKVTGDGVIGLSRCLFLAGVPSVIVSLWSVPDEPTQYLMIEFYCNLQGGMNKAKALRQAILTTKQKFRSPVNWAGFTLIGESE